jgi:3-deoxy-7-phosphoheptulonate synthase
MIVQLKPDVNEAKAQELGREWSAFVIREAEGYTLITPSKMKQVEEKFTSLVAKSVPMDDDIQLANRKYKKETRTVRISDKISVGGATHNTMVITGPCSVESEQQIDQAARLCVEMGVGVLRAGAYKPRTSPYTFQGMGLEGLKLLAKMREKYGLKIITEIRDSTHVNEVIEYADILQIGAKAMYDHGILKSAGKSNKPVLLKRGFGTTLQEFVQSAEFILSGGNPNVMLCERGIRTFETKTRFTLDLCGVAYLKEYTNLPVVLDPSHAMGYAYGVADLARACTAMGIDGLLIETHPDPSVAKSDASQQLNFEQFTALYRSLGPVANAVGYKIV